MPITCARRTSANSGSQYSQLPNAQQRPLLVRVRLFPGSEHRCRAFFRSCRPDQEGCRPSDHNKTICSLFCWPLAHVSVTIILGVSEKNKRSQFGLWAAHGIITHIKLNSPCFVPTHTMTLLPSLVLQYISYAQLGYTTIPHLVSTPALVTVLSLSSTYKKPEYFLFLPH